MPNPYTARVDVCRFLNLPGFHGGAYVVAYVEDTSEREITKRDSYGNHVGRYVNPEPRMILEIADCQKRINLEFEIDSQLDVENSVHKLDTLIEALAEFPAGLLEEVDLYRVRESRVDRLNVASRPRLSAPSGSAADAEGRGPGRTAGSPARAEPARRP